MTSHKAPTFANITTTDNQVLHFDNVICVSQNHNINNGEIFEVIGEDKDTLTIKRGEITASICTDTLTLECEKRNAHFLPLFSIKEAKGLKVHNHGLVTLGKRYGYDETIATHGKDALLVSEAKVTINGLELSFTMQGYMTADGEYQLKKSYDQITNIADVNPLAFIEWEVKCDVFNQIMKHYQTSVAELDTELRDKIVAHIDETNPTLRFDNHHIADATTELLVLPAYKQYSEYEIEDAFHIVINNYDKYMQAYRANQATLAS